MGSEFFSTTIGEQLTLQRGFDITKKDQRPGPIPIVSSGGTSSYHDEAKMPGPGVVLGRKGTLGTVFFLPQAYWPHDTTLWVKDFKGNDPRFVYYFFKGMSEELKKMDVGAANPTLNRNHVHPLEVLWPSKIMQRRIADFLGALDNKIALNRQINTTLESMAQALFKSWFVDFDPVIDNTLAAGHEIPDELQARADRRRALLSANTETAAARLPQDIQQLFPDRFVFTEEMGWVPEGWEVSNAGDEFFVQGGSTPSTKKSEYWDGGTIHWTTPKDLSGNQTKLLIDTDRKITEEGLQSITSGLLPVGTVLLSSRAPVGYLAINKIPVAINQGYIALSCDKTLSPEYAIQWLDSIVDHLKSISGGTTFAEISKKTFKTVSLLVPPKTLVDQFSAIIKSYYDKVLVAEREIQSLEQLRDSLLPKLLSGELEIGDNFD
jgi:type I restriction enzyme, S subunit